MVIAPVLRTISAVLALMLVAVAPAAAVQPGKVYRNLSFPHIGRLDQIEAPYLVLEVMRTSCPHCQKEAPAMNKFHQLVQGSDLKGKVKFLAVAQNSGAAEVNKFKKAYAVPFPMVADPQGTVGRALQIQGVPTVVVLKRDGQVLRVHVGGLDSPKEALTELRAFIK